jgi:transposase
LPGDTARECLGAFGQRVAQALLLNDAPVRGWRKLFEQRAIVGITSFDVGGWASYLSVTQEDDMKAWVGAALPPSTRQIGAFIGREFGLAYESRSGLIALLHRLGLAYLKLDVISRKRNEAQQKAFIERYDKLLNSLTDNEAVAFADAVQPTHGARPTGCWVPSQENWIRSRCTIRCSSSSMSFSTRAPSSCQAHAGMARSARAPNHSAFHPALLPTSGGYRASRTGM